MLRQIEESSGLSRATAKAAEDPTWASEVGLTTDGVVIRPEDPWMRGLEDMDDEQSAPTTKPTEKPKAGSSGAGAKSKRAGSPESGASSWEVLDSDLEGSGVLVPQVNQAQKGTAKGQAPTKGGPAKSQ
jgi:hypothetical protein